MNSSFRIRVVRNRATSTWLTTLALAVGIAGNAVGSPDVPEPGSTKADVSRTPAVPLEPYTVEESQSPKTHTLFMGADIALNLDKDLYRVHDVEGSSWVVDINGKDKVISARQAPTSLKITPTLKLTESSVTITGFMRTRAYSFNNDPSVLLTQGLSRSSSIGTDLQSVANTQQAKMDTAENHALGGASLLVGSDDQFNANALLVTAEYSYANLHTTGVTPGIIHFPLPSSVLPSSTDTTGYPTLPGMQIFADRTQQITVGITQAAAINAANQTEMGNEATGKIATSGLDAMDVTFDIRSPKILRNPYVVTMARFRAPNSKPNMVQNMVYAKSLHPIDEHVSHIHFVEEGFPYGYELIDFQLHIYNRGEEIASNIAANRVELTRDEAFEYVKVEYIGAHKGDTLPPTPAMGKFPSELQGRLASGQYEQTFFAKVSRDGLSHEVYADADCTKRLSDPFLETVIEDIRFKPALDHGNPVAGVAAVNLHKLAL